MSFSIVNGIAYIFSTWTKKTYIYMFLECFFSYDSFSIRKNKYYVQEGLKKNTYFQQAYNQFYKKN